MYNLDDSVSASEGSSASFGQVGITDTRSVSGTGNVQADQSYSGSEGYTGQAVFQAIDATGSLTGSATIKPDSLSANQRISTSGSQITVGSWAADGGSESETKTTLKSARGTQGSFDGIASLSAGHSTDALISSHITGALESIVSATGSTTSTRNSNGAPWDADQFLHAQTPGTPGVTDLLTFRISPLFRIQPAIDFAKTGDTIKVPAGFYPEDVNIYKWISLIGFGNPTARSFSLTNGAQLGPGSGGISAPVVTVNQGSKIQDGITLASNSGIVNVNGGTYGDNLDQSFYAKGVTLTGINNPVTSSFTLDQDVAGKISGITANTVIVNPNAKIQDGVNLASSGGTVNVAAGTYKENVQIDKSLTVKGAGATQTIIDGNKVDSVFAIEPNAAVTLSGMTITNGNAANGGGIYNKGTLTLKDSIISGNTGGYGGGIDNSGTATVIGSAIYGNTAIGIEGTYNNGGGGIYNSRMLTVKDSIISENAASQWGGGIYNGGAATVIGSTISGNTAVEAGGGIYTGGIATIISSTINGNTATYESATPSGSSGNGGGIDNWGTVTLKDCTIYENTATYGTGGTVTASGLGGGIYNGGTATISGGTICGNTAFYGGGIFSVGTINLNEGSITENIAKIGGGIFNSGTATITTSTISGNTANNNGGGIYNDLRGIVTLNGGSIAGNRAIYGDYGGGIMNYGGTMNINDASIAQNIAYDGAGICNYGGTLNLKAVSISNNYATNSGGGICSIVGFKGPSKLTADRVTISGNTAGNNGGGIYSDHGSTVTINEGSSIANNQAGRGGGIFNFFGGAVTFIDSTGNIVAEWPGSYNPNNDPYGFFHPHNFPDDIISVNYY